MLRDQSFKPPVHDSLWGYLHKIHKRALNVISILTEEEAHLCVSVSLTSVASFVFSSSGFLVLSLDSLGLHVCFLCISLERLISQNMILFLKFMLPLSFP